MYENKSPLTYNTFSKKISSSGWKFYCVACVHQYKIYNLKIYSFFQTITRTNISLNMLSVISPTFKC